MIPCLTDETPAQAKDSPLNTLTLARCAHDVETGREIPRIALALYSGSERNSDISLSWTVPGTYCHDNTSA